MDCVILTYILLRASPTVRKIYLLMTVWHHLYLNLPKLSATAKIKSFFRVWHVPKKWFRMYNDSCAVFRPSNTEDVQHEYMCISWRHFWPLLVSPCGPPSATTITAIRTLLSRTPVLRNPLTRNLPSRVRALGLAIRRSKTSWSATPLFADPKIRSRGILWSIIECKQQSNEQDDTGFCSLSSHYGWRLAWFYGGRLTRGLRRLKGNEGKNNETRAAWMKSCSVMAETITRTHTVSSRMSVLKWFYSIAYKFYKFYM